MYGSRNPGCVHVRSYDNRPAVHVLMYDTHRPARVTIVLLFVGPCMIITVLSLCLYMPIVVLIVLSCILVIVVCKAMICER